METANKKSFVSGFLDVIHNFFPTMEEKLDKINERRYVDEVKHKEWSLHQGKILKCIKEVKKLEKKNCILLFASSYAIYNTIYNDARAQKYRVLLAKFLMEMKKIIENKERKLQFSELEQLYTNLWLPVRAYLERDFKDQRKIKKAIAEVEKQFQLLASEIAQKQKFLSALAEKT